MNNMKMVEISNLSYSYDDGTVALDDVNLSIETGESVAILGPNGAGKSTILKIIAGLLFPFNGVVRLAGSELKYQNADQLRNGIGILFQDPDDQIFMPRVWDDIAFGPINLGLDEHEVRKRVKEALALTDLMGYEDRSPHHLSYGEKKRVAIAGIIAMKPRLLLLDEFTANLDPKGRGEIMDVIKRLKTTVILVTHNINTALKMADRIIVLNKKVIGSGTPSEIFSNENLLTRSHLDVPEITKLFMELNKKGFEFSELPYSFESAVIQLAKLKPS
jgi:cobalt/nickel transport system ATP-binding protein